MNHTSNDAIARTVILSQPGSRLTGQAKRFCVYRKEGELVKIPAAYVRHFVVCSGVEVESGALRTAMKCGIPLFFISHTGQLEGHVDGVNGSDASIRLAQYQAYVDKTTRLQIARKLVLGKIRNSVAILKRFRKNHPEFDCREAVGRMEQMMVAADRAEDLDGLRGCEGLTARCYFDVFGRMLLRNFEFHGRNRQPPRDPVNAMLSFGYTVMTRELTAMVEIEGLDPFLGYLHEVVPRRPSLALDLLEPLRAWIVDRFVITLVNLGQIAPEDFAPDGETADGIYLTPAGYKLFLRELENWLAGATPDAASLFEHPRAEIQRQVALFKQALRSGQWEKWEVAGFDQGE